MNSIELVSQFISTATWEGLPAEVQHKARMCLMDNLGGTLAGTLTRVSQIGADYALETWPGDEATILLHGKRASAIGAAYANACAANGLDVDDSARYAYGHAGAQIFPTALAIAEARSLSGAQLLCAMVVGYEVAHRVGRCWHDSRQVYQACGSWGSVACAAVAAHLMGLSTEQVKHALGIAEYHAANLPMMRDVDNPSMVKHGIEWAAMTGISSAELASRGFTGIPSILSLEKYQDWGQDIGRNYLMVEGVAWKPAQYACCGWAHGGVEGARRLMEDHQMALDDIANIRVEGSHGTMRLGTKLPTTTEEAQFNQAWPLAAMLVDGEIGPGQMLEYRLLDSQIREIAQKVEVFESEEMEELCRLFEQGDPNGRFASVVTITLKNGQTFNSGMVDGGLQFPPSAWDEGRMADKFRWLANYVLDVNTVDETMDLLFHFEELSNVRQLTQKLFGTLQKRGVTEQSHDRHRSIFLTNPFKEEQ
jgi:2-methylcitrate dehydratase PrpD